MTTAPSARPAQPAQLWRSALGTNAKPGDGLTLTTQAGTLDFIVIAVETYGKGQAPACQR